jgi:hypothetical protein
LPAYKEISMRLKAICIMALFPVLLGGLLLAVAQDLPVQGLTGVYAGTGIGVMRQGVEVPWDRSGTSAGG